MSKTAKRFVWLGLLIIATLLTLSLIWILQEEPSYQNRDLSSWIADLPRPITLGPISGPIAPFIRPLLTQKEQAAGEAIRAMGTNALPVLLRMARRTDGTMSRRVVTWINKQKFLGLKIAPADQRRAEACTALQELGVKAIPAWTAILLDEKIPLQTREFAAVSLAHMRTANSSGPLFPATYRRETTMDASVQPLRDQAWRALTKALDSTNAVIRSNTASYIGGFGPQAKGAIPKLLEHAEDPDPGVRAACIGAMSRCEPDTALALIRTLKYERGRRRAGAAASLGLLKQRPEESVQVLMLVAQDDDYYVREAAISAIADFKSKASHAIPMLQTACNDTNKFVRRAATNALLEIMPKPTIDPRSEALSTK